MAKKFQIAADNQATVRASLDVETCGDNHFIYFQLDGEIVLSICSNGTGDLYEGDIATALGNKKHTTEVHK